MRKKPVLLIKDLINIKRIAAEKEMENDVFRIFLNQQEGVQIDAIVHKLNTEITPGIDCTQCGNCCKSLITVTSEETLSLAKHLQISPTGFKEKYIEESEQGRMIVNAIPCHFLSSGRCTIYEHRFTQCRDFPYLHKPNFTGRLFGTLMYYPVCPIIFNVVERLKEELNFKTLHPQ
jgi:Fe-S-cluster containining protein